MSVALKTLDMNHATVPNLDQFQSKMISSEFVYDYEINALHGIFQNIFKYITI